MKNLFKKLFKTNKEYLVGISYHEPKAWQQWNNGEIEDYESSIGLFIQANSINEAIEWGNHVGQELLRFVNNDPALNWKDLGYSCWHESNIKKSGWSHCLNFFQHVKAGEQPNFKDMTSDAYAQWKKNNL
jgi:hypothetical protein